MPNSPSLLLSLLSPGQVFDRNKTGFIDVDELRMVMKDLGENVSEEDLDAMMKVIKL